MSVNRVTLIGHVGKDPDVKHFDNGTAVASFSLATTEKGYTAQNGTTIPDRTEWHNIVCLRGLAKVAEQFVKKGSQLYIEGKIRSRSYDDANGVKRYVTEVYVDNLELLGGKSNQNSESEQTPVESQHTTASIGEEDDLPF